MADGIQYATSIRIVTFLPLVGALMILPITMSDQQGEVELAKRNARNVALFTTVVTFLISLLIYGFNFDNSDRRVSVRGGTRKYRLGWRPL